uniref:Uncharacterized protein n=1 Tax=Cacopsylla melanoneura TaxID=428564 RepID=A0A8D9E9K5_9HEMI
MSIHFFLHPIPSHYLMSCLHHAFHISLLPPLQHHSLFPFIFQLFIRTIFLYLLLFPSHVLIIMLDSSLSPFSSSSSSHTSLLSIRSSHSSLLISPTLLSSTFFIPFPLCLLYPFFLICSARLFHFLPYPIFSQPPFLSFSLSPPLSPIPLYTTVCKLNIERLLGNSIVPVCVHWITTIRYGLLLTYHEGT